ncbi:MAG: hypothetical protein K0R59_791 [Sphingobacterium sp.]|jgi:hypothetical protein|nr:hypothetical protein [Sphingobacterium sp.]
MEIQYLQHLRDNPEAYPNSKFKFEIRPISTEEIEALEQKYNNSKPFPKALRELLYLAGDSCYVFDYIFDTVDEM